MALEWGSKILTEESAGASFGLANKPNVFPLNFIACFLRNIIEKVKIEFLVMNRTYEKTSASKLLFHLSLVRAVSYAREFDGALNYSLRPTGLVALKV